MRLYYCTCGAIRNSLAECKDKTVEHRTVIVADGNDDEFTRKVEFTKNSVYPHFYPLKLKSHSRHFEEVSEEITERTGDIKE